MSIQLELTVNLSTPSKGDHSFTIKPPSISEGNPAYFSLETEKQVSELTDRIREIFGLVTGVRQYSKEDLRH